MKETKRAVPKVLAVDFDNTISKYDGWKGEGVFGPPIDKENMIAELKELKADGWHIVIWTTRKDHNKIRSWLNQLRIPWDAIDHNKYAPENVINSRKIRADIYLDDKGLFFPGHWSGMAETIKLKYMLQSSPEPVINPDDYLQAGEKRVIRTPDQILHDAADLFKNKNSKANYGDGYYRFGDVMMGLFPEGLLLSTKEDWVKFGILGAIVSKVMRLSNVIFQELDEGEVENRNDNAKDGSVYMAMLASVLEDYESANENRNSDHDK